MLSKMCLNCNKFNVVCSGEYQEINCKYRTISLPKVTKEDVLNRLNINFYKTENDDSFCSNDIVCIKTEEGVKEALDTRYEYESWALEYYKKHHYTKNFFHRILTYDEYIEDCKTFQYCVSNANGVYIPDTPEYK